VQPDVRLAHGIEQSRDRRCRRQDHAPRLDVPGEVRPQLVVQVRYEHGGRRTLPHGRQPGHGLLVGRDRVAGALHAEHELDAECRIGRVPEDDAERLLEDTVRFGVAGRRGDQWSDDALEARRHLGGLGRRPQIHPGGGDLPLVEQRPARLAACGERPLVEGIAVRRGHVPGGTHRWQADREPGLDDPHVEQAVPPPPGGERRGEFVEHGSGAGGRDGALELVEACATAHRPASIRRTAS